MRRAALVDAIAGLSLLAITIKLAVASSLLGTSGYPPHRFPSLTRSAVVLAIAAFLCLLNRRPRMVMSLLIDAAITALIVSDVLSHRFFGDVLSVADVRAIGNLRFVVPSIVATLRAQDAFWIADLLVLIPAAWVVARATPRAVGRRVALAAACAGLAFVMGLPALWVARTDPDEVMAYAFQRGELIGAVGLLGYHFYDAVVQVADPMLGRLTVSASATTELEHQLAARRSEQFVSPLSGVARGRNVIMVSLESLQSFALGLREAGRPLTPHLDAFAKESLHYTSFFDQTYLGTTSDAETTALTSLLPLDAGTIATRFSSNRFRALPHVFGEHGYSTVAATAEPSTFWNMGRMHPALGFQESLFEDAFTGEWVGVGLEDTSFLSQVTGKLAARNPPLFAYLISSTSHHPYDLPARLRQGQHLLSGTMAGDYLEAVQYLDRAFGVFVDGLAKTGLLDSSVIIVFGDHQAWLEDQDLQRLWTWSHPDRAATPLELWQMRRKVPLMIRLPHGERAGERDVPGGHLDLAPTVLSLTGLEEAPGPWLGRDLTAPARRLVVFRDGSVTDGQTYRLQSADGAAACFGKTGITIPCLLIEERRQEGRALREASDSIVRGDLVGLLTDALANDPWARPAVGHVDVIAHRGLSLAYPENTLKAIDAAFAAGADAAEIDVRLSRDGVPVVFHDDTLERTSNGHGHVEALTVAELKRLDAGAWMATRFAGERIPTLEEVVRLVKGRGRLLLDLKVEGMATAIAAVYSRAAVDPSDAMIGAWTDTERADFAAHMPGARILRTAAAPIVWGENHYPLARKAGVWGFEVGDDWPGAFIADARVHGLPVIAYTANDELTLRRLLEVGVSGIETDNAALLLRVLGRTSPHPPGS